ncbi:Protein angel 2 [Lobosporangium transversale]|nr:Protein angel 2 [Lobosporangium transversale]
MNEKQQLQEHQNVRPGQIRSSQPLPIDYHQNQQRSLRPQLTGQVYGRYSSQMPRQPRVPNPQRVGHSQSQLADQVYGRYSSQAPRRPWAPNSQRTVHSQPQFQGQEQGNGRQQFGFRPQNYVSRTPGSHDGNYTNEREASGSQDYHKHGQARRPTYKNVIHPIKRRWDRYQDQKKDNFTIMTYNLLADSLARSNSSLYQGYGSHSVMWKYRKQTLLRELGHLGELDFMHFEKDFSEQFQKWGYTGVYKKRNGDKIDGCALFYRNKT